MQSHPIPAAKALRIIGVFSFALAILTVLVSVITYLPIDRDFSIFTTYLSDIGDTSVWPQILFNTGTLLAAPLRYVFIVLLVLRLRSFGVGKQSFEIAVLTIGAFSTLGTVFMTAVPFSVQPAVHKSGIGLYFLGVVFLQILIGVRECSSQGMPKILPFLSFTIVISYLVFFLLVMLYETGNVARHVPVFWEWMCFFTSTSWLLAHSLILGRESSVMGSG